MKTDTLAFAVVVLLCLLYFAAEWKVRSGK